MQNKIYILFGLNGEVLCSTTKYAQVEEFSESGDYEDEAYWVMYTVYNTRNFKSEIPCMISPVNLGPVYLVVKLKELKEAELKK